MNVALPEDMERQFTPDEIRLHLALGLFLDDRVTLGQGAAVAGLSQSEFLHELGKRKLSVHYDEADLRADIAAVERWGR
jgi:predicted HTH domain antitoxin